jgi:hypothetical protein
MMHRARYVFIQFSQHYSRKQLVTPSANSLAGDVAKLLARTWAVVVTCCIHYSQLEESSFSCVKYRKKPKKLSEVEEK